MAGWRVGQFTDSYPPIVNGVSTVVAQLHAALLERGQVMHVFTFAAPGDEPDPPNVWRTRGVRLGTSHFHVGARLNAASTRAAQTLQVVHAHDSLGIGLIAERIARRLGARLVFTNHTRHDHYIRNFPPGIRPLAWRYALGTVRRLARSSAVITTPSYDSARWLRSLMPERAGRIRVIHNSTRLEQFERITDRMPRDEFGIGAESVVFIYTGRLSPEKNLSVFAEAFVRAVRDGADAHWLVVGQGASRAALASQTAPAGPRVHFVGAVPHQRIGAYLAMADVLAMPSLTETNSLSVIEAIACGLPYVGLVANWWEDFTADAGQQLGGILAGRDPAELAAAIRRLCDDAGLRRSLGEQARRISRRFDVRTVAPRWIELYGELVNADD